MNTRAAVIIEANPSGVEVLFKGRELFVNRVEVIPYQQTNHPFFSSNDTR
jgi:hypothetical protein